MDCSTPGFLVLHYLPELVNRHIAAAAAAKSLQSCLTLCDPIDGSPLGSPVPGILKARTLEWVAIFFSNAWKWKVKVKSLSRVQPQQPHGLQPTRLHRPWDSPGKNTGVGCHFLVSILFYGWIVFHSTVTTVCLLVSPLVDICAVSVFLIIMKSAAVNIHVQIFE